MNTVNTFAQKASVIRPDIETSLRAGLVPMLWGSPGIGKSDLIREIAKEFKLFVIDHRLSTSDPTDLSGFPNIINGKASYIPFDLFPVNAKGDIPATEIPEGYEGWLLLLDELPSAVPAVQAAAYKLCLDRQVGQYDLHDKCLVIAAGNYDTDGAVSHDMGTALQSRLIHFQMRVDVEDWLDWAFKEGIDPSITAYIQEAGDKLYSFNPDHDNLTFQCPRTWYFLSRFIKAAGGVNPAHINGYYGCIGPGAREFVEFCSLSSHLPKVADILKEPTKIDIPKDRSVLFFLCNNIAAAITKENFPSAVKFTSRLDVEFELITLKNLIRRDDSFMETPEIVEWINKNQGLFE